MKNKCGKNDEFQLVERAKEGDDEAFALLVASYSRLIKRTAAGYHVPGMETDDLMQEGLVGLLRGIRTFRPELSSFSTYASLCIASEMAGAVRHGLADKQKPLNDYALWEDAVFPAAASDMRDRPEEMVSRKEQAEESKNKIATLLSDFERQVLKAYLGGHSYSEIASDTSSTPKAVDNALQRVRKKLRPE